MLDDDLAAQSPPRAEATVAGQDSRAAVGYLVVPEAGEYIAVMDVLESSVTEMTSAEVRAARQHTGLHLPISIVEDRLEKLVDRGAASHKSDTTRARWYSDLMARNWRYTATYIGLGTGRPAGV